MQINLHMFLLVILFRNSGALHPRSSNSTLDPAVATRSFNKDLPESYRCCNGTDTMENSNWRILCVDDNKATYKLTTCEIPHFFQADFAKPENMHFFVETGVVFFGNKRYVEEINPNTTCFGNETIRGYPRLMVLLCLEENEEEEVPEEIKEKAPIAGALSLISAPFLVMVVIVYASMPELRDLQGESILCLCCTFLISSILIANENLQILAISRTCHSGGDLLYFTLMASVFWMSVICIQTFVSLRFPSIKTPWKRQFIWYSFYAWGLPSFLVVHAIFVAHVTPGSLVLRSMDLTFNCWTYDDEDEWKYYLAPLTASIALSCLLLAYSAWLLHRQSATSNFKTLRHSYLLNLKIFAVVGISWLNEPFQKLHGGSNVMWVIGDCWNLLQGVLLFIVLVLLRKRVMRALLDKNTFCAVDWLRRYTDKMTDHEDTVAIVAEENSLTEVNISHKNNERQ